MRSRNTQTRERIGAHRPRRSPWRDLVSSVAVLVVVVLVAAGAWMLTRSTASSIDSSGPDDVSSDQGGAATPIPMAPSTTASAGTTGTTGPTETPVTTASTPASPPAGAVDRSTPVTVLNSTKTSGLAASVAQTLRAAAWTVPTTDNYRRTSPPTTVVYGAADQRATALAVAGDIGGAPRVQQSSEFGRERITVIIGSDYAG